MSPPLSTALLPLTLRGPSAQFWVHPAVAAAAALNPADPGFFVEAGRLMDPGTPFQEMLKDDPVRSRVVLKKAWNQSWVVKWYFSHPLRQLLGHFTRSTPAWREWRAAGQLVAAGRRGNRPLALFHPIGATGAGSRAQGLILPYVPGQPLNQFIAQAPAPENWGADYRRKRLILADQIGRQMGHLLNSGLVNRDHKLSNLILDAGCEREGLEPVIIDPLGIGRLRNRKQIYKMLPMLIRTTHRAGFFTTREGMACLRALLREHRFTLERPAAVARRVRSRVPGIRPGASR